MMNMFWLNIQNAVISISETNMKFILIAILTSLISSQTSAQYFVLDERSTERYSNYWNQMMWIEKTLRSGSADPRLRPSKTFNISAEQIKAMSAKFKEYLPGDFYDKDYIILDTDIKR